MHEVLVNRLGGLSLPRKSVVKLTDRPDMTLDVYRGRKTTIQQQQHQPETRQASSLVESPTPRERFHYPTWSLMMDCNNPRKIFAKIHVV